MEIKFEEFKEVFCKTFENCYSPEEIYEETLIFDLKIDSLDIIQIMYEMEANFSIKINDCIYNKINKDTTLKNLHDYILKFQMN